jgi:ABC-2 type transport system permease protein
MADNGRGKTKNSLKNIIIFLTAAAVVLACAEIYGEGSLRMRNIAALISVFLVPLFAFAAGLHLRPTKGGKEPRPASLLMIGAAYAAMKLISCFVGVYFLKRSFWEAFLSEDRAWIFPALIVWILAARALGRLRPAAGVLTGVVLGTAAGLLPAFPLSDRVSGMLVFLPFFLAGSYLGSERAVAVTDRRPLKIASFFAAALIFIAPVLLNVKMPGDMADLFSGRLISGPPLYRLAARLAAYAASAVVAALWFCGIPRRKFVFTGFAKRAFQVFFWHSVIIQLWLHMDMNSIFGQIWAEHWKVFFFASMAIVMLFVAIIPLPLFDRFPERVLAGRWHLPDEGDPVFKRMRQYSFLFSELVKRDFKKKYKRTVLGMLWSVLSPLLTLLVMWLVFSQFFGRNTPHYTVYIFAGTLVFSYFTESTSEGMSSLVGNSSIFTKVNVPKYLFLLSKNISSLISFGLTLVVFFVFVAADKLPFTWNYLFLLFPICCLVLFNIGVGLILSALFVFFRDIKYLWSVFTRLLMYMSAIFYTIDRYSEVAQHLFLLNPVYVYIRYFRKIVIENTVPTLWFHLIAAVYGIFFFYMGFRMYKKYNTKFLYYV